MDEFITLDHGSGGKKTSELIENLIVPAFDNEALSQLGDGAVVDSTEKIVFSTDSFVITPCFFPGGDIGKLSVCGTVNDVSMCGGEAKFLSLAAIIEEGFPIKDLERIINSAKDTAKKAGVQIVTGDTKVVEKGKCDGIYLNTAGIGYLRHPGLSPERIRKGDIVLVSGTIGDHGTAIMLARNPGLISGEIVSDCAPLNGLAAALRELGDDLKVLRDPTRGGLATTLCEFVEKSELAIVLDETSIPISDEVKGACDILGMDPLYMANEGKLIAVVSPECADRALELLRSERYGENACIIGEVTGDFPGNVLVRTRIGGSRILKKLSGLNLPRIC